MTEETSKLIEKGLNDSYDLAITHATEIIKAQVEVEIPHGVVYYILNDLISSISKLKKDTQCPKT